MITSVQAVPMNWPLNASIRPMITPPSMAPGTLPMPPSTAAVKARSPAVKPMIEAGEVVVEAEDHARPRRPAPSRGRTRS